MRKVVLLSAVVALIAAPAFAADVVLMEDFNGPFYTPNGYLDERPYFGNSTQGWYSLGYGSPAMWDKHSGNALRPVPPTATPDGSEAQAFEVPGSAYNIDPTGTGQMIHLDNSYTPAHNVDLVAFANANGTGTVDTSKPIQVTADVMIRMDNKNDYNSAKITFDWWFDDNTGTKTFHQYGFDTGGLNTLAGNNVWVNDYVLLDYTSFPTDVNMSASWFFDFQVNNASAGDMEFYVDDLKLVYNIPEPATMALLGLGGIGLLRRRRHA